MIITKKENIIIHCPEINYCFMSYFQDYDIKIKENNNLKNKRFAVLELK